MYILFIYFFFDSNVIQSSSVLNAVLCILFPEKINEKANANAKRIIKQGELIEHQNKKIQAEAGTSCFIFLILQALSKILANDIFFSEKTTWHFM